MADGWTEERASFQSNDLASYLRVNRLLGIINGWRLREGQTHDQLCADLVTLVNYIRTGQPLPGAPKPIDCPPGRSRS